jgi:hypothetical protein
VVLPAVVAADRYGRVLMHDERSAAAAAARVICPVPAVRCKWCRGEVRVEAVARGGGVIRVVGKCGRHGSLPAGEMVFGYQDQEPGTETKRRTGA